MILVFLIGVFFRAHFYIHLSRINILHTAILHNIILYRFYEHENICPGGVFDGWIGPPPLAYFF